MKPPPWGLLVSVAIRQFKAIEWNICQFVRNEHSNDWRFPVSSRAIKQFSMVQAPSNRVLIDNASDQPSGLHFVHANRNSSLAVGCFHDGRFWENEKRRGLWLVRLLFAQGTSHVLPSSRNGSGLRGECEYTNLLLFAQGHSRHSPIHK